MGMGDDCARNADRDERNDGCVLLGHGSGGAMSKRLIDDVFYQEFSAPGLDSAPLLAGNDSGVAPLGGAGAGGVGADGAGAGGAGAGGVGAGGASPRIAMSCDSFVVTPWEFPGGDIGRLAVCGTVNDVATSGATVRYLSCAFVIEEGFHLASLRKVCRSMADAAREAGVAIITGDTKVVERGHADGLFVSTAGVGELAPGVSLSGASCQPGDVVLLSGSLGDHGIAVMSRREGLSFVTHVQSDAAPLNHLVAAVRDAAPHVRCFRDPTRGGLASTLNEFADASGVAIEVDEASVPVHDEVRAACDLLGYDVFQVANEGKMVAVVPAEEADAALAAMRGSRYGEEAAAIGQVLARIGADDVPVRVRSPWGSTRVLDMLVGEQLPRIC